MGNSLQDQLLKAGAANKQQAQKANKQRRKKQNRKNKGAAPEVDKNKEQVQQAQVEKAERDRELNRKNQEEVERKAVAGQIRQLIEMNRLPRDEGETPFNFVDGTSVKKLFVTKTVHEELGRGRLSVVKFGNGYEVVPAAVAKKLAERDASLVIAQSESDSVDDGDDPYADYKVPDDLMW